MIVSGFLNKNKVILGVIFLILIGAFLRFYNLNWGAPFYFHPDERNIATAVTQLRFPEQMSPHFFAYGSLPIYIIYFTGLIVNVFTNFSATHLPTEVEALVGFEHAIIIGRAYSALLSTLLIPLLFFLGKKIKDTNLGLLVAFLATFSTGFIQFAHFGTFEMWLTFFTTLLFWLCLRTVRKRTVSNIFLLALVSGILVATKISHLVILPLPVIAILSKDFQYYRSLFKARHKKNEEAISLHLQRFAKIIICLLFFAAVSIAVYFLTNPYVIFDYQSFLSSMKYESDLASGSLPVFYTQGFYDTIPIVFQFNRVFPFIINPLLTSIFLPAFFYVIFLAIKKRVIGYQLLVISFLLIFLPQAFLFAKWTRYMVPTLPFIYLIISIVVLKLLLRFKKVLSIKYLVFSIILISSIVFSLSYFITAFTQPDTRIAAGEFVKLNVPDDSKSLTEPYDLGAMAFNSHLPTIYHFNFYDLDPNNAVLEEELRARSSESEYIILPSQRLLKSRLLNKNKYPRGHTFYSNLTNGQLGFQKIYETPCDLTCKVAYLGDPIFSFEETATVFDRPTVFIYKKIQ